MNRLRSWLVAAVAIVLAVPFGLLAQAQDASADPGPPLRKTPASVQALFSGPPIIALGAFLSAPLTSATDTLWASPGAVGRLQSAVYAGNPGTAAAGLFLYLYQVDCTGGNVTNPDFKVPLGSAAGQLNTSLFGAKFIEIPSTGLVGTVGSPAFPGLPLPPYSGNFSSFNLSEFGSLGGQVAEGFHDVSELSGFMVADIDNTGIFWSSTLVGFVTTVAPIIGAATITGPVSFGPNTVAAVVPSGTPTVTPPSGEIIVAPPPPAADTTPPTTTVTQTPAPNAAGWNNTNVTLAFTATDAAPAGVTPSGVNSVMVKVNLVAQPCPTGPSCTVVLTSEGVFTVEYHASDNAGNPEAPKTLTVKIDKTKPVITASASTASGPYVSGTWTNKDVTVSFTCSDALSGVASLTGPITVSSEGADQSVTGTCTDKAGNSASATFSGINIDKTPPTVACVPTTNPSGNNVPKAGNNPASGQNPDGFYALHASDNLSGVAAGIFLSDTGSSFVAGPFPDGTKIKLTQAPGVTPTSKPGPGVITAHILIKGDALVTATDLAGNTASVSCLVPPPPK